MDAPLSLINRYRPNAFAQVVGHATVLSALQRVMSEDSAPHSYLLTGPSGIGKTTIARIIGDKLECEINEIDAASNSGVDAMRELVETGQHMSLAGTGRRMFLVDEVQVLSKVAWQALLKLVEEPPAHLYWAFCTTELPKVPETIITRCYHVALKPLASAEVEDLLLAVCGVEEWDVAQDVLQAVIQAATGQPRKALSLLQAVHGVKDRDEVRRIITLQDAGEPLIEICQALLQGRGSWEIIKDLLVQIEDDQFDQAALVAGRYIAAAMVRADSEKKAKQAWTLLDALLYPVESWDRKASFYRAVGHMVWPG